MFCPSCGNSNQQPESFCRQCGNFLPDFDNVKSKEIPPEQHFTANIVLNVMTAVASLTLAILLYVFFLGKADTPILIYITAGFLTAMFFWQAQVFWRNWQLKKQFPGLKERKQRKAETVQNQPQIDSAKTRELLNDANLSDFINPSVVEETTKHLAEKVKRKSS